MNSEHQDRRDFLKIVTGAGAAAFVLPVLAGCTGSPTNNPPADIVVDVSAINLAGKSLVTTQAGTDGKLIAVICQAKDSFLALSMQCTHQGCQVSPPASSFLVCPCHGSTYDLKGDVVIGPATAALGKYTTQYDPATQKLTIKMS